MSVGSEVATLAKTISELLGRISFDVLSILLVLGIAPFRILKQLGAGSGRSGRQRLDHVLITGASSGIGAGLARMFAKAGSHLILVAWKDQDNLERVKSECLGLGAKTVQVINQDVSDEDGMVKCVEGVDKVTPLDVVIANAGVMPHKDGLLEARRVIQVNVMGALNTIIPAITCMRKRKRGQIAMTSSLGGYAPSASNFLLSYTASKAAIRSLAQGMRYNLAREGIGLTLLCPGFTETRMTKTLLANGCRLYGIWDNETAAKVMFEGIRANNAEVVFPHHLFVVTRILGNLPTIVAELLAPYIHMGDPFRPMDKLS